MKKVTLIVPDSIDVMIGSSRGAKRKKVDVTPGALLKVLCDRSDYHVHHYFGDPGLVKVEGIEDFMTEPG
jgi:hypothetical protein